MDLTIGFVIVVISILLVLILMFGLILIEIYRWKKLLKKEKSQRFKRDSKLNLTKSKFRFWKRKQ